MRTRETALARIGSGGKKRIIAIQSQTANITTGDATNFVSTSPIITTRRIIRIRLDGTEIDLLTASAIDLGVVELSQLIAIYLMTGITIVAMVPLHHSRKK
ncbi:hypothetical protein [Aeromonas sp. L_1B5_3]|uniref:hypothetical protein n=1 Tax=Aeromonas sp. L_1B5_3 TaxID=1588629 RepID=UPI0022B1E0B7|nr:hypothetical protein [Aeromonas sp. L_1B5_3]